jgi:hypothetical protein
MGRVQLVAALGMMACGATSLAACSADVSRIALAMRAPQGLLDTATGVELLVLDAAQTSCSGNTVSGPLDGDGAQSFALEQSGCVPGASWCKTITLDRDDSTKVFAVRASAAGQLIAEGCTTAVVDQDPLEIAITVERRNNPKCCGNGTLEVGEQCDSGALASVDCAGNPASSEAAAACLGVEPDAVCECDCLAREILLSIEGLNPTLDNDPGSKLELALAFSGPAGQLADGLRAVYTDTANGGDINVRMLQKDLFPFSDPPALTKQLRLPLCTNVLAQMGPVRTQKTPAASRISDSEVAVVYASDETQAARFDIFLSAQGPNGCADSPALLVNDRGGGSTASAEFPAVAGGPGGAALVVWAEAGALLGRIRAADGSLPAGNIDIASLAPGSRPRLAATPGGWLVAYHGAGSGDGDGVFTRTVDPTGVVGTETRVNTVTDGVQDQPDVATLPDGRALVVWRGPGGVLFQRFDASGTPVGLDQDQPLSLDSPGAATPVASGGAGLGDFFAVAWLANDGSVWGRYLGGSSGFGFNSVTGQNGDFLASHPGLAVPRSGPAIAVGGAGFVAMGWSVTSDDAHHGVFVRRLPLPQL